MYLLDELTKEYQKTLLKEAETVRRFKPAGANHPEATNWRVITGDFLILAGVKLKGQSRSANKHAHASHTTF